MMAIGILDELKNNTILSKYDESISGRMGHDNTDIWDSIREKFSPIKISEKLQNRVPTCPNSDSMRPNHVPNAPLYVLPPESPSSEAPKSGKIEKPNPMSTKTKCNILANIYNSEGPMDAISLALMSVISENFCISWLKRVKNIETLDGDEKENSTSKVRWTEETEGS